MTTDASDRKIFNPKEGIAAEHFPIPWGGAAVFMDVVFIVVASFFLKYIGCNIYLALVISVLLSASMFPIAHGRSWFSWMSAYIDRNVIGRKAVFQLNRDELKHPEVWVYIKSLSTSKFPFDYYPSGSMVLPLGGWWKRPFYQEVPDMRSAWKVLWYEKEPGFCSFRVQIQDRDGDRITLSIAPLMVLLCRYAPVFRVLSDCVYQMQLQHQTLYVDLCAHRKSAENLFQAGLNTLKKLNSSRQTFGRSKEARRIKYALAKEMVEASPSNSAFLDPYIDKEVSA